MASAVFNALKFLPASLGVKMIKKKFPKFKSFFADAAAYGYDADRALSYLSDRFGSTGADYDQQLAANQSNLRPDELAAQQQIAAAKQPGKIAKTVASYGGAALLTPRGEEAESAQQPVPSDVFLRKNPELGRFLERKINEGISPMDAARRAKAVMKFRNPIMDLEESMGQKFEDIVGQVFGTPGGAPQSSISSAKGDLINAINQTMGLLGRRQ